MIDQMSDELMDRVFGPRQIRRRPLNIIGDILNATFVSRQLSGYTHYGDQRSVKKKKVSPADISRKKKQSAQKKARKITRRR